MMQAVASTQFVEAESAAAIVKLLSAEAVECQPMGVVDQDLRCIGHPKAMTEPAFAELSVLPACTWEEHIKPP